MGFAEAKWAADNIIKECFSATITVNTNKGANVTFTKGSFSETVACPTGVCVYKVRELGEWTVKVEKSGNAETKQVTLNGWGSNSVVKIRPSGVYGISRNTNNPSTAWTRTDDSVGLTATASVGTQAGHSDFNDCYPWKNMKREILSTGDIMVKIPEFYYKRYVQNDVEHIQISDKQINGFAKHPGSGCYIGAYKTGYAIHSLPGLPYTDGQTRDRMRTQARSKGSGWGLIDIATWNAIQMLYLVEFADNDSQKKIGRGSVEKDSSIKTLTGNCDYVTGLTGRASGTDGKTGIVYRGIEGLWGRTAEWVDGIVVANNEWWICTNPNNYIDGSNSGHFKLNYKAGNSGNSIGYIKKMGVDSSHSWAMLPSEFGGSDSTYYPDYGSISLSSSFFVPCVGGTRHSTGQYGSQGGLFTLHTYSGIAESFVGTRFVYKSS